MKNDKVSNTLYISDLQCGDKLAICPESLGGSPLQHKLWLNYLECLDWFAKVNKGERFLIIFGAEMMQGTWFKFDAEKLPKQFKILKAVMDAILERGVPVKSYLLQGNEAHTGFDNEFHEILELFGFTKPFNFVLDKHNERFAWPELKIKYPNDCVLHATHFFNFTNIYPMTAYQREYKEIGLDYLHTGEMPPDVYYRAHVHREGWLPLENHPRTKVGVFTTPGWQLKGVYARKQLARLKRTEYGLAMTCIEDGKLVYKCKKGIVKQAEVEIA